MIYEAEIELARLLLECGESHDSARQDQPSAVCGDSPRNTTFDIKQVAWQRDDAPGERASQAAQRDN